MTDANEPQVCVSLSVLSYVLDELFNAGRLNAAQVARGQDQHREVPDA